jgi:hypothetical protein
MSIQFQGILKITGNGEHNKAKAEKQAEKFKKGISLSLTKTVHEQFEVNVLTKQDAVAFAQKMGVDVQQKERFVWYRPIKSLKAKIGEMQSIVNRMQPMFDNMSQYEKSFRAYLAEHSEKDAAGKPVVQKEFN